MKQYFKLEQNLVSRLYSLSEESERNRAHFNLHEDYEQLVQKTLIALTREAYIPPHYHKLKRQKELFILLAGKVKVIFFDNYGVVKDIQYLKQGDLLEVYPNIIHTVVSVSEKSLIMEIKEGPFNPDKAKELPSWSLREQDSKSIKYLNWLYDASVGDNYDFD